MFYLLNLFLGILAAFVGLLPPSMLNMTAARTTLEKDRGAALRFSAGASVVVFFQAYIALAFTKYISHYPGFIEILQKAALVIFLGLMVFFFYQARNQQKKKGSNSRKRASDLAFGALLSTLNVLAIPFYCAVSTMFEVEGWIRLEQPFIILFVTGATLGTFGLLLVYIRFAGIIQKRAGYIARNINYILSGLSLLLFFITLIKVLNK